MWEECCQYHASSAVLGQWYIIKEKVFGIEFQKFLRMHVHHWEREGGEEDMASLPAAVSWPPE